MENNGNIKEANVELENYNSESFTQLLTAHPTCDDDSLYDGDLFQMLVTWYFRRILGGATIVFCGLSVQVKWPNLLLQNLNEKC